MGKSVCKITKNVQIVLLIMFVYGSTFSQTSSTGIERLLNTKLRIASYNVFWGSVFPQDSGEPPLPGRHNAQDRTSNFVRIHNAVKPDIWALQEVLYSKIERETKTLQGHLDYFNKVTSENWNVAADEKGRMVFSRYPIKWKKEIALRMFTVLIDLPDSISREDLLLVNVHLHWKDPEQRAKEARMIANFLKDVIDGKNSDVPTNSLLMVCGDFNSRRDDLPYKIISSLNPTLNIEGDYSPMLKDQQPLQLKNHSPISSGSVMFDDGSTVVQGGTIDFMLFSGKSLKMTNNFMLNTLTLDQKTLDINKLECNDVALDPNQPLKGKVSFDHLPLIADFSNKK
ncbi:endonuclease/exonuclease/phosphatase family protein [Snuella sedimenti]|uniref:Endonuclease/exonuclease/phosphatase family protein n=1 Tax=Snuella sedimenti TaxID=2798802 RepID=A0A8J7LPN6_9FLAO|nr:endonuclease/exonuclease/phosphatase family protein [Snuella sedimenti]MBJ6369613.1 endonuclease/exonuclease/phosphatase family protein [Snuella sedimenti]